MKSHKAGIMALTSVALGSAMAGSAALGAECVPSEPGDRPPVPEPSEPQATFPADGPQTNQWGVEEGSVYATLFGMDRDPDTLTAAERDKLKYHQLRKRDKALREKHGNWVGKHRGAVALASGSVEIIQMAPPKNSQAVVTKMRGKGLPQGKALRVRRAV